MANILKPELVWIEGRCYRVNDVNGDLSAFHEHDLYENETTTYDVMDDAGDDDFEVTALDNGRFSTQFHVSQHFLGSVIGKKAAIKRKIESDTRTEIRIPKPGQNGDIVVQGSSATSVKIARRRINMVVMSTRSKQRPTHFISIPMNSSPIVASFNKFKEEILEEQRDRGLDETMFVEAAKLHLTLCMLCLMDDQERQIASKLLEEARDKIIIPALQGQPLRVAVRGVSYMNDEPREVRVLYGGVQETTEPPRLQRLADDVMEHFISSGFSQRDFGRDSVKLHVTLINAKYGKGAGDDGDEEPAAAAAARRSFDATRILERYARLEFGEQAVTEVHLSQRHAVGADGYYQPTCVVTCDPSASARA